MSARIWITWEIQRRNRSMSKILNASLHELIYDGPFWRRYPVLAIRTIGLIMRNRSSIVFAQNPSLMLAVLSVSLGHLFNISVIIDAHNAGLYPLDGRSRLLTKIATWVNRHASMVIVSNDSLKATVEGYGGKAISIPDPIPDIDCKQGGSLPARLTGDRFDIVLVCSWADDEPYLEVLEAAHSVDSSVRIYMTGNSKGRHLKNGSDMPENVVLTGFLSQDDYDALICGCDSIMVLTTREDCLVCGAYEGVAVEKPLILTGTRALIEYFNQGCAYTDNTVNGIAEAVDKVVNEHGKLAQAVTALKSDLQVNMDSIISDFEKSLDCLIER